MDLTEKYPALTNVIGYLHQDWKDDYDWEGAEPMFEAVVRHYKAENPPTTVKQATQELNQFLALPLSDKKLHRIVEEEFHSWYTPRTRDMDKRQFLEAVLSILKEREETPSLKRQEQPVNDGWKEYVDEETKRMLNIK